MVAFYCSVLLILGFTIMAFIFKGYRPRIAMRMNPSFSENRWFTAATYAKTNNGYFVAWDDDLNRVAVLTPNHPEGEECMWFESWDKNDTIETFFDYIESSRCEDEKDMVFNLFIQNPETGEWE